jgi:hypothetical protein
LSSRSLDKGILRPIFVFESCKNTKGIYDTWDISQDCEEETYPKLHHAAILEKHAQRRQKNGNQDVATRSQAASFPHDDVKL